MCVAGLIAGNGHRRPREPSTGERGRKPATPRESASTTPSRAPRGVASRPPCVGRPWAARRLPVAGRPQGGRRPPSVLLIPLACYELSFVLSRHVTVMVWLFQIWTHSSVWLFQIWTHKRGEQIQSAPQCTYNLFALNGLLTARLSAQGFAKPSVYPLR